MKIQFENGNTIEGIKSENQTRGKMREYIFGIDLAKGESVQHIKCPRCETINYIKDEQDHHKCNECGARFNILKYTPN